MNAYQHLFIGLALLSACGAPGQPPSTSGGDRVFEPDSIAVGIVLCDTVSALKVIGRVEPQDEPGDLPRAMFLNRDSTEVFTVFAHYGGFRNEYCEFRIEHAPDSAAYPVLQLDHFASGKGVRLGMSEAEIVSLFGSDFSRSATEGGGVKLSYAITDMAASAFLQRFNYPSYYAHFTLGKDGLSQYRFGFEYP